MSTYQRGTNILRQRPDRGRVAALSRRPRRPQLFRHARHLLLRLFRSRRRRAKFRVIHPVVDYSYVFGQPVLGGELSYRANLTSLSRASADFNPIIAAAFTNGLCALDKRRPGCENPRQLPAARHSGHLHPRLRRGAVEAQLHRSLRADLHAVRQVAGGRRGGFGRPTLPGVANYLAPGDSTEFRVMPTVGLEYRYPFISVQSWGTQTIEPIAQVIVRPERDQHRQAAERGFPKPDLRRQQPVQDRQVRRLGPHRRRRPRQRRRSIHRAVQSRRLRHRPVRPVVSVVRRQLVRSSATTPTPVSTAASTPRDPITWRGFRYQPDRIYSFTTRFRFDQDTFEVRQFEAEARASFDRWSVSVLYGKYDAAAAARLPDAARGHPRHRLGQADARTGSPPPRCATTSTPTRWPAPCSASATSTIASSSP